MQRGVNLKTFRRCPSAQLTAAPESSAVGALHRDAAAATVRRTLQ